MAQTGTVIAGLIYADGVLIAADSQASDPGPPGIDHVGVRWPTIKLNRVGNHPLVVGFSGNTGLADGVVRDLNAATWHPNQFKKRKLVQDALDKVYAPLFKSAASRIFVPAGDRLGLWGLAAFWAEGKPWLLEHEWNAACSPHQFFHAIGSGKQTAYATYHTLGRERLCTLPENKALMALVRIIDTCLKVDWIGVGGDIHVWRVTERGASEYSLSELDAQRMLVDEWIVREREVLFGPPER